MPTTTDKPTQAGPVSGLSVIALLAAFEEHEKWLEAEIAAMEKDRDQYAKADHHGLPYARDVLKMIRKRVFVDLRRMWARAHRRSQRTRPPTPDVNPTLAVTTAGRGSESHYRVTPLALSLSICSTSYSCLNDLSTHDSANRC